MLRAVAGAPVRDGASNRRWECASTGPIAVSRGAMTDDEDPFGDITDVGSPDPATATQHRF